MRASSRATRASSLAIRDLIGAHRIVDFGPRLASRHLIGSWTTARAGAIVFASRDSATIDFTVFVLYITLLGPDPLLDAVAGKLCVLGDALVVLYTVGVPSGKIGILHLVASRCCFRGLNVQVLHPKRRSILHVPVLVLLDKLRLLQVLHGSPLSQVGHLGQRLSVGMGIVEAVWIALFENLGLR